MAVQQQGNMLVQTDITTIRTLPSSGRGRRVGGVISRPVRRAAIYGIAGLLVCHVVVASVDAQDDVRAAANVEDRERLRIRRLRINGLLGNSADGNHIALYVLQNAINVEQIREQIDQQLMARIADIDRGCLLTDEQKQKLRLAAAGDIKRFFEKLDHLKDKNNKDRNDRRHIQKFLLEIAPLQKQYVSNLFGDQSLFAKYLQSTLSAEQSDRLDYWNKTKWQRNFEERVKLAVNDLEKTTPLNPEQRKQLIASIVAAGKPLIKTGQLDYHVVWYYAAQVRPEKLKPQFTAEQWEAISHRMALGKRLEVTLKRNGYIN